MVVLKPPGWGWEHVTRGAEPSPGQAVPCVATSSCPAANPGTGPPVQGALPQQPPTGICAQRGVPLSTCFPCRFLCGTVNDFVAEVGRAYKRAMENKQEAELMARKVGFRGAGWHSLQPRRGRVCSLLCMHWGALCSGCLGTQGHQSVWSSWQRWSVLVVGMPRRYRCQASTGWPGERPAPVEAMACAGVLSVGVSCSVPC